jgi:hypothetical protein
MIVSAERLHRAIITFFEEEVATKATGLTKFATYFVLASLYNHPEKTVGAILDNPLIKMTGIVNEQGEINADDLYSAARSAMEKAKSITLSGITFSIPDIDHIYSILQRG